MKKLLLALGAASLALTATPAVSKPHHGYHHKHHHDNGFKIRVYTTPYYGYNYRPYRNYRDYSYDGPIWRVGNFYRCVKPYGTYGILRDRYGRVINAYRGLYTYPSPYRCR